MVLEAYSEDVGIVFRCGSALLAFRDQAPTLKMSLSILEIYNDRARDLLNHNTLHKNDLRELKFKSHPKVGVICPGLTEDVVASSNDLRELVDFANKLRVVASTNMNSQSSRSHAIVQLNLAEGATGDRVAQLVLERIHTPEVH